MNNPVVAQIIPIVVFSMAAVFFLYRYFLSKDAATQRFTLILLLCAILLLIQSYNALQEALGNTLPWWQYTFGIVVYILACQFGYFMIDQLINNNVRSFIETFKHRVSLIVMCHLIIIVFIDYIRRDNLMSVINPRDFEPSWRYLTAQMIYNSAMVYISVMIINLYWKRCQIHGDIESFVRRVLCLLAFITGLLFVSIAVINTILSYYTDNHYRVMLYEIVQNVGKPIDFVLLVLGFAVPKTVYNLMLSPVERHIERRRLEQHNQLVYLHSKLIQIVHRVNVADAIDDDEELVYEIDDARDYIWSHEPRVRPLTPASEAEHYYSLLHTHTVISEPGYATPQSITDDRVKLKHYVAIAQRLQRLAMKSAGVEGNDEFKHPRILSS